MSEYHVVTYGESDDAVRHEGRWADCTRPECHPSTPDVTDEAETTNNLLAVISKHTGQTEEQARETVLRALDRALGKSRPNDEEV